MAQWTVTVRFEAGEPLPGLSDARSMVMAAFEFEYLRQLFARTSTMSEAALAARTSREFLYRLLRRRVGDWRILCQIDKETRIVYVLDVIRRTSTSY